MNIRLSDHFSFGRLLRFTMPSIVMMIFTSVYGVVDGLFVSNFVGKTSFAAINLILPLVMAMGCGGFMIGTGGSALVSKTLGEGDQKKANEIFSLLVYFTVAVGLALSVVGLIFLRPVAVMMGAEGQILEDALLYGRILLLTQTFFMVQNVFQSFFVTAEKPQLGLAVTVAAGVTNIVLDFVFIVLLRMGLLGAAMATVTSQVVGGAIPLLYFSGSNRSRLQLTRTHIDWAALWKTCTNGSSELMTNLSMSLVNFLYNLRLMQMIGEDGVAAYGVIMYLNFIFISIFLGYSVGCAPIVSFHFGAAGHDELKNLFRKSLVILCTAGVLLTGAGLVLATPLATVFVGYDAGLLALTSRGMSLYALSFLFAGLNIFGSAFFTALNNGAISAFISFLRTMVFQVAAVLLLPLVMGVDGIWLAILAAEGLALCVTLVCLVTQGKRYRYL